MDAGQLLGPVAGMTLAAAARHYAEAGIPVFPCVPEAKRPLLEHGFHEASTDTAQVIAWWRRWPTANIGIPTGPASGIEVVDVDVKGAEPRGPNSWQQATRAGLLTGWAAHVVTPSGGLHAYHPAATAEQRSWASASAQLDFRGSGGYIVAPPSQAIVAGVRTPYRLLELSVNPAMPVDAIRLRDFLDPRPVRAFGPPRPVPGTVRERAERLAGWLRAQSERQRNQGLFWASCRLAEDGLDVQAAVDALGPVAETIGLPPGEIERTIRSAYRSAHPASAAASTGGHPAPTAPARRETSLPTGGRAIA